MAAVAPSAFGGNSYALVAVQTAKNTKGTTLIEKVYPVTEGSDLRLQTTPIEPALLTGSSGASKPFSGPRRVEGGLTVPLGSTHAGIWLKELTGDTDIKTTAITGGEIVAAASYTAGTALPAVASGKQPHELIDDPVDAGQLTFTIAGATGAGSIYVKGTDQLDREIDETIAFTNPVGAHKSTLYYKTITMILPQGEVAGGTLAVMCAPEVNKHELSVQEALTNGLTIELVKGGVPNTYDSVHVASGTLNIGEFITLALTMIGRNAATYQNITGGADPTTVTSYDRFDGSVNLGYQTLFKIDDEIFPLISASLEFNQNLEVAERLYRSIFGLGAQRAAGTRTASISAEIDYSKDVNFNQRAEGDEIVAELSTAHLPRGGKHSSITFMFKKATIVNYPDPAIVPGAIPETLDIRGFTTGAGGEMDVVVINSEAKADFGA